MADPKPTPWHKLPRTHPLRIHHEFTQARGNLRRVRGDIRAADAEPSQWEIELEQIHPGALDGMRPTQRQFEKAQGHYERARALWEAAGRPNNEGQRTSPRDRKRFAELVAQMRGARP